MRTRLEARAIERIAPALQPGEQPMAAGRAIVGKFEAGRFGTIAKRGLLVGGAGVLAGAVGGAFGATLTMTKNQFVVVTNRRLIFMSQTFMGGLGKKVLGEVPRDIVSLVEVKIGIVSLLRIAFGTVGDGVTLTIPRQDKKGAESLAAALQQSHGA